MRWKFRWPATKTDRETVPPPPDEPVINRDWSFESSSLHVVGPLEDTMIEVGGSDIKITARGKESVLARLDVNKLTGGIARIIYTQPDTAIVVPSLPWGKKVLWLASAPH